MEEQEFIFEVLDLIKAKIKRGDCTKKETDAIYDAMLNYVDVYATSEDLAKHFGKSVEAVHGVIKRRMIQKPKKNITLYSFKAFRKIVPQGWLRKRQ